MAGFDFGDFHAEAAAGVVLSALNPKNLLLAISGAAAIASVGAATADEIVAYIVFVLVATLGVGAPVVIYFALGDRSGPLLERLKAVLLLVIGVKLIGDAITGFST